MKIALAEKLLVKVMDWTTDEVAEERPLIQAMAKLKYDEYQQFSPGIRFTESLARWLSQFEPVERRGAYAFIKSNLIFISSEQMSHLVNICFPMKINPWLLEKASKEVGLPGYFVKKIGESKEYAEIKRKSLFLGISDGAKIDQLRRLSGISNEQVFSSYYISVEKKNDLLKELENEGLSGKFNSVYLIDDFTGSGLSYARVEDGKSTGKIIKFLKLVFNIGVDPDIHSALPDLINVKEADFHILFYIAKESALVYLRNEIQRWKDSNSLNFSFSVDAIQAIGDNYKDSTLLNEQIVNLSKKHITKKIIDRHYKKGKHDEFYLGFDECALPLVIHHNTPNNSLPILWWYPEDEEFRGLFPRVTRHRE